MHGHDYCCCYLMGLPEANVDFSEVFSKFPLTHLNLCVSPKSYPRGGGATRTRETTALHIFLEVGPTLILCTSALKIKGLQPDIHTAWASNGMDCCSAFQLFRLGQQCSPSHTSRCVSPAHLTASAKPLFVAADDDHPAAQLMAQKAAALYRALVDSRARWATVFHVPQAHVDQVLQNPHIQRVQKPIFEHLRASASNGVPLLVLQCKSSAEECDAACRSVNVKQANVSGWHERLGHDALKEKIKFLGAKEQKAYLSNIESAPLCESHK